MLLEAARTELAGGRYRAARALAGRHAEQNPGDARPQLTLAEIDRREGDPARQDEALAGYRRALALDPSAAEGWRGLGLVLKRRGDLPGARDALARYLALAPQATDRAMIAAELRALSGGVP
ncbi:MAG TPA: tetratricopeptide repeat protein [Anaeromyxobacteraceae bacterium]|nr:tetratricopeptide repeat protein [Anaeromyxobacteraceae bacterium]